MTATLTGDKLLDRKLAQMDRKVQNKMVRDGLKAGLQPILDEAKANAPVKRGLLKRSLKIRGAKRRRGTIGRAIITKEGFFKGEAFYAGFVEFGTKFIKPRKFIKRAFDRRKQQALDTTRREMAKAVREASR